MATQTPFPHIEWLTIELENKTYRWHAGPARTPAATDVLSSKQGFDVKEDCLEDAVRYLARFHPELIVAALR